MAERQLVPNVALPLRGGNYGLCGQVRQPWSITTYRIQFQKANLLTFRHGIVVIDECPGVNLEHYDEPGLLDNHLQVMRELIARDKNRPSVVMWSIANEPRSDNDKAKGYFHAVANLTRSLDPSRPITLATYYPVSTDQGLIALLPRGPSPLRCSD